MQFPFCRGQRPPRTWSVLLLFVLPRFHFTFLPAGFDKHDRVTRYFGNRRDGAETMKLALGLPLVRAAVNRRRDGNGVSRLLDFNYKIHDNTSILFLSKCMRLRIKTILQKNISLIFRPTI